MTPDTYAWSETGSSSSGPDDLTEPTEVSGRGFLGSSRPVTAGGIIVRARVLTHRGRERRWHLILSSAPGDSYPGKTGASKTVKSATRSARMLKDTSCTTKTDTCP